jgi:hypothetical protein
MTSWLTRPIPRIAWDCLGAYPGGLAQEHLEWWASWESTLTHRWLDHGARISAPADPPGLAEHATAHAAFLVLMRCPKYVRSTEPVGEFLAVLADRGVTRPILDMAEVGLPQERASTRAGASLEPMDLSEADARAIHEAMAAGSARPKVRIAKLSQHEG